MHVELRHRPAYALAICHLDAGETITAEGGAMVSKDTHVSMETVANAKGGGGILSGLASGLKRLVAGESFFVNRFTAAGAPGHVTLAPTLPGDLEVHDLARGALMLQSSAYVAAEAGVTVDASWGGARSFFGGEGLILLKATGVGQVVFCSFGGIREIDVDGTYVVDTGHIVAFEDSLTFDVGRFGGGWLTLLLGGEGLVCTFKGRGKLWIQTRNPNEFGGLMSRLLPPREA
jgi:uncharacterized protein (TIGR00266 family)